MCNMDDLERTKKKDIIIAYYKADIFEYEDGRLDICYICDKEKNRECSKEYCTNIECYNTTKKKYAKNFLKR